ncbi:MAG: DUF2207 domain-containing protein, partial [Bacteroidota bacterium]
MAEEMMYESIEAQARILENGSIEVEEIIEVRIKYPEFRPVRSFATRFLTDRLPGWERDKTADRVLYDLFESAIWEDGMWKRMLNDQSRGRDPHELKLGGWAPPGPGIHRYKIKYRVWGALDPAGDNVQLYFPWLSAGPQAPVRKARLTIRWPEECRPAEGRNHLVAGIESEKLQWKLFQDGAILSTTSPLRNINSSPASALSITRGSIKETAPPMRLYSKRYYFPRYQITYSFSENGNVHVAHEATLDKGPGEAVWQHKIRHRFSPWDYPSLGDSLYEARYPALLGDEANYLLRNVEAPQRIQAGHDAAGGKWRFADNGPTKDSVRHTYRFSYDLYGMLRSEPEGMRFSFPVLEGVQEPIEEAVIVIEVPGAPELDLEKVVLRVHNHHNYQLPLYNITYENGRMEIRFVPGLHPEQTIVVDVLLPRGSVGSSLWLEARLFFQNHTMLSMAFLLILPFFFLWYLIGRNRKFTPVVQFYPPEGITPTEAGLLIDNKLHNRDLLSLIYYWGAQGIVKIK